MSKASYSEWGRLSWKPDGSIGLGHNHSHLTDSTAAILGNHERGVQAGSQLKLQCRILKIIQPHDKPPLDKTMKWLHNGQKVRGCLLLLTAELLSKIMLGRHDFIFCARARLLFPAGIFLALRRDSQAGCFSIGKKVQPICPG